MHTYIYIYKVCINNSGLNNRKAFQILKFNRLKMFQLIFTIEIRFFLLTRYRSFKKSSKLYDF